MEPAQLEELVEEKIQRVLRGNNQELLTSITGMLNKISGTNSTNSTPVVPVVKFKRKSNEIQYNENAKILSHISMAETAIEAGNIDNARENIIEARDTVKRRQKLIKLADASELGLRVVEEYQTNPIASDSEDARRIYKAEARASRKARSERTKKAKAFQSIYAVRGFISSAAERGTSEDSPRAMFPVW